MSNSKAPAKIILEIDRCIGAGQCVRAAPTVFAQNDDDALAYLLQEEVGSELRDAVDNAARWCPARAILIENLKEKNKA